MSLHTNFTKACEKVEKLHKTLNNSTILKIYGYYKQATEGDATGKRPSILKLRDRTKYDAWAAVSGMSKEAAMGAYVELTKSLEIEDQSISCEEREAALEDKHALAKEMLNKELDLEEYEEIKSLWKAHSIAEDNRDIDGLMATLTEDCRYEIPQVGKIYYNKEGATQFYYDLLGAFPDIDFRLTQIYIGPQGVVEEAKVKATHEKDWLVLPASGEEVEFETAIFFPWDSKAKRFKGERVYFNFDRKFYKKYGMEPPFPELKE